MKFIEYLKNTIDDGSIFDYLVMHEIVLAMCYYIGTVTKRDKNAHK